jgi:hypothetical protein
VQRVPSNPWRGVVPAAAPGECRGSPTDRAARQCPEEWPGYLALVSPPNALRSENCFLNFLGSMRGGGC